MTVKLDILSDPICPWCYIGKRNLDAALAERPGHGFEIEWHPFQLNPGMPAGGMDRREYLEAKFGGKEGAVKVYSRIAEAARAAGIEINFEGIDKTPSTTDAHRLIHWAGLEGRQTAVVEALFRAYFEDGRDIGDKAVLAEIAGEAGLDKAMVATLLEGDNDRDMIAARDNHARERGVQGVPCFILGQRYVVSGAQTPDVWTKVIDELSAEAAAE